MTHETAQKRIRNYTKLRFLVFSCVFVFCFVFFGVGWAEAAMFYLQPSSGTLNPGDTFFLEAFLDTEGESINAVEAHVRIPPDTFEVLDVDYAGSFLALWPRMPAFSPADGSVSFTAGTAEPFSGREGFIGRILLKVKDVEDRGTFSFDDSTRAILTDGKGTPASSRFLEASFDVIKSSSGGIPGLSSTSHPDPLKWFSNPTLVVHWEVSPGMEYSYLVSQDLFASPDETADTPVGDIRYEKLDDGIYYFHIRELGTEGEARSGKLRVMIDTMPPAEFEVRFTPAKDDLGGRAFLSFSAQDTTSGLLRYRLCKREKEDAPLTDCRNVSPPILLEGDELNERTLAVEAYDKAGNVREASVNIPRQFRWHWAIVAAGGGIFMALVLNMIRGGRIKTFLEVFFGSHNIL